MLTHAHVMIPTRLSGSKHALKTYPVCVGWTSCQRDINPGVQHWIFMECLTIAGKETFQSLLLMWEKRTRRTYNMYPQGLSWVRGLKMGI